jgi:hypothetical protein
MASIDPCAANWSPPRGKGTSDERNDQHLPTRRRRWIVSVALVAGGLLSGVVLAGTQIA